MKGKKPVNHKPQEMPTPEIIPNPQPPEPAPVITPGPDRVIMSMGAYPGKIGMIPPEAFKPGFYDAGIRHLFDNLKIMMIGRLKPDSVKVLSRISIAASQMDLEDWDAAADIYIKYGIAENGKGRDDILRIVEGMTGKKKNIFDKAKEALGGQPSERDL